MPELPEVESVRRQLAPDFVGFRVTSVTVDEPMRRYLRPLDAEGHTVTEVTRRGKYLVAPLSGGLDLILHLGMTGALRWDGATDRYIRAELTGVRHDGLVATLQFRDVRRFGTFATVPHGQYHELPTLNALGPEPLSDAFTVETFTADLTKTRQMIKPFLLSQRPVAGVGNIYADEALWDAGIHPRSRRVGPQRAAALHRAIKSVIAAAIDREGTTFRDYQMMNGESGRNADFLIAYGQAGLPCPRCSTTMRKIVVAGRGTTYCPHCQRN